jgi:hypothetical protein
MTPDLHYSPPKESSRPIGSGGMLRNAALIRVCVLQLMPGTTCGHTCGPFLISPPKKEGEDRRDATRWSVQHETNDDFSSLLGPHDLFVLADQSLNLVAMRRALLPMSANTRNNADSSVGRTRGGCEE